MLYCRREIYPAEVEGSYKYFAAATAKAEIWRGPLAFGVSPLVNGSDAELLLLLPEHRDKIMLHWSESLGDVVGGDASGGGGGNAADALMVFVIFGFQKKKRKWHRRLVYAATAKSPGDFLKSSQKISEGKYNWFYLLLSLN